MSRPAPAAEASEEPRPPSPPSSTTMPSLHSVGTHVCFILCGVFTVYAAVSRGPLVVPLLPAQPAAPFFSRGDPVTDYFTGDTTAALERAATGHASLLFFYAPWDSDSQSARQELVGAARILSGQVDVLAINCWHVTGDCRRKLKNITVFPFVVVSLRYGRGVQYTGPLEAAHLVRFVQRILRPLRRLETVGDLALLQAASTTIAVGYTPFVDGRPPPSYFSLLRAALLSTEERPNADLAWAVVTNARAAARLRLEHPGGLAVVNWNGTTILKQPAKGVLTAELMKSYVALRRREMAGWLELPGSKSNTLRLVLSQGATLLVLDRRRPLAPAADMETLAPVRRVWLDYNNCNRSETVHIMGKLQNTISTGLSPAERQKTASCQQWAEGGGPTPPGPDTASCPGGTVSAGQPDSRAGQPDSRAGQPDSRTGQPVSRAGQPDSCQRRPDSGGSSPDSFRHADPGLQKMVRQQRTSHCRGLLLDLQLQQKHQQEQPQQQEQKQEAAPVHITGLRCTTNRTLSVYVLDYVRHAALARRLGLTNGGAGAVILDRQAESQYVMEGAVTVASLSQFISDHTAGRLRRTLVSRTVSVALSSPPESGADCGGGSEGSAAEEGCPGSSVSGKVGGPVWSFETVEITAGGGTQGDDAARVDGLSSSCDGLSSVDGLSLDVGGEAAPVPGRGEAAPVPGRGEAAPVPGRGKAAPGPGRRPSVRPLTGLTEMTSETFRQVALNDTEDVIVFFYSKGCGHCSAYYHVFLAAMRLFMNSGLRSARIDGAANDLRWEFSLESFPTIMYLPAHRKSESRVFPADLPLTLSYLLRFILANASGAVRHAFFYSQCDAACRATTAYKARRQTALVRRRQLSGARRTLVRHAAELARLRRALRVAVTARTEFDGS